MRTLNTSLPTTYTNRPVPPEQLLQAFKSAALSVTNLYKSAVQDQNNNRAAGYQDALDDLIKFLDAENLGLQDGEGWRVRQWVTERYDGTANQPDAESEDEKSEPEAARAPSASPVVSAVAQLQPTSATQSDHTMETNREAVHHNDVPAANNGPLSDFRFTYPSDSSARMLQTEREMNSAPPLSSPVSDTEASSPITHRTPTSGRGNRVPHRNPALRHGMRTLSRTTSSASGAKRKNPFPDLNFFDITNLGPRDGNDPSSKRGRYA